MVTPAVSDRDALRQRYSEPGRRRAEVAHRAPPTVGQAIALRFVHAIVESRLGRLGVPVSLPSRMTSNEELSDLIAGTSLPVVGRRDAADEVFQGDCHWDPSRSKSVGRARPTQYSVSRRTPHGRSAEHCSRGDATSQVASTSFMRLARANNQPLSASTTRLRTGRCAMIAKHFTGALADLIARHPDRRERRHSLRRQQMSSRPAYGNLRRHMELLHWHSRQGADRRTRRSQASPPGSSKTLLFVATWPWDKVVI